MTEKEALANLCSAVLTQARRDYITGTSQELRSLQVFVRSDLFQLYTLGVNLDPEDVLKAWEDERREYRAERIRIRHRVEREKTQD